ncbi:putative acetyltransferase [Dysgonomonas sp. PH5-45]|uniref:N-acetyltransferase n=1 Tax=unclassified Dysgonomonas TaxID=2630389 RepID=UPI0024763D83|nr:MULTISPECIES: N-acetyltransferase [unclassified Dysgonomonas]MDH6354567.1 putative acetyltransferase [Dysgonomonas sp. PH5-45]MDH6387377.1 putative acetyltransferase [Dysgonomonas sp. PH5-37]
MIREINPSDVEAVMDIWLRTNVSAHFFIPESYWVNNFEEVKNEYLPGATSYVYEEEGTVKAFVSIVDDYFIGALFVGEEYQRLGVGNELINYCKEIYSRLDVTVYAENANAVKFYEKEGFRIIERRPDFDTKREELLMRWG